VTSTDILELNCESIYKKKIASPSGTIFL